jgi:hypothetical protein
MISENEVLIYTTTTETAIVTRSGIQGSRMNYHWQSNDFIELECATKMWAGPLPE